MNGRHVLLLSTARPPDACPAASRTRILAEAAMRSGSRVTLVSIDDATLALRAERTTPLELPRGIDLIAISPPSAPGDPLVSRWSRQRLERPEQWNVQVSAATRAAWADPDLALWRPRAESAVVLLNGRHPIDLVVAVVPASVTVAVAVRLLEHASVPFVIDVEARWSPERVAGDGTDRLVTWWRWSVGRAWEIWSDDPETANGHAARHPAAVGRAAASARLDDAFAELSHRWEPRP